MRSRQFFRTGIVILGMVAVVPAALACTGGALTAKDGGVVVGRTLEFGQPPDSQLAVWPAGSQFTGTTESGNNGLAFTSEYGFIGATIGTVYDQILDGMTFFTQTAPEPPDTIAAVGALFHTLNDFDILYGSNRPPPGSPENDDEFTTWTAVSDPKKLQFHGKNDGHQSVRVIDLREALHQAGRQLIHRDMGPQEPTDVLASTAVGMK